MAYTQLGLSIRDYSKEMGTTAVYVGNAILDADLATLKAAMLAMSYGAENEWRKILVTPVSNFPAASSAAQREERVLVRYQDNTTLEIGTFSIPCFNKGTVNFVSNSDFIEIGAGASTATSTLITQLQSFALSKAGNAISVLSLQYIGRNS